MGVLAQFAKTKPANMKGEKIRAGSGRLVLKNARTFKSKEDGKTIAVIDFYVKESKKTESDVEPNPPGSVVSVFEQWNPNPGDADWKSKKAMERLMAYICGWLGADFEKQVDVEKEKDLEQFFRIGADGYTDQAAGPCPLAGLETSFVATSRIDEGKKTEFTNLSFGYVTNTPESIAANRTALGL